MLLLLRQLQSNRKGTQDNVLPPSLQRSSLMSISSIRTFQLPQRTFPVHRTYKKKLPVSSIGLVDTLRMCRLRREGPDIRLDMPCTFFDQLMKNILFRNLYKSKTLRLRGVPQGTECIVMLLKQRTYPRHTLCISRRSPYEIDLVRNLSTVGVMLLLK
jgi:hypothetical protein